MEIGTFAGGSASLMSKNQKVKKIVSVDIGFPIKKEIPIKNVNNSNCIEKLYTLLGKFGTHINDSFFEIAIEIVKQLFPTLSTENIMFLDNFVDFICSNNLVNKVSYFKTIILYKVTIGIKYNKFCN
jgi:hypothetical protein